jgi:hypothetical protein
MTAEPGRRLTDAESTIVSAFLALPLLVPLRRQLPGLRVVGICGCGCPTVFFQGAIDGRKLIADAQVGNTDGDAVLLFAAGEFLTSLEYLWLGETPPATWPPTSWLSALRTS